MVDAMSTKCQNGVVMRFETTIPDDVEFSTNGSAVEALIRHLLDNAIHYTTHGSILLSCCQRENWIRVSVTDTGIGIPKERQAHIFDMFTPDTQNNAQLNGMGLSICQSIVRLLKGRIWLDADYTEGSRFCFELPAVHIQA